MPAEFDRAVKAGARVQTVSGPNDRFGLAEGEYMHIAILGGRVVKGERKRNVREALLRRSSASRKEK